MPKRDQSMSNPGPFTKPQRGNARRPGVLATALFVSLATSAILVNNAAGDAHTRAHTARTLNVTDTAHLHFLKESSSQLIDEGAATGTLPGTVRVSFDLGVTVSGTFTIYAHDGSIIGHGSGVLHKNNSQSDVYVSFGGTMTVSHGTGRYAHAHGTGGFYGVIDRRNYSATIQTTGSLSY
jgi:hypothetical protein